MTDEDLALIGLRAWNDVPTDYPFEWPKNFPEGSRAAWKRVVIAIKENAAATGVKSSETGPLTHDSLTASSRGGSEGISEELGSLPQQTAERDREWECKAAIPSLFIERKIMTPEERRKVRNKALRDAASMVLATLPRRPPLNTPAFAKAAAGNILSLVEPK